MITKESSQKISRRFRIQMYSIQLHVTHIRKKLMMVSLLIVEY